MTEKSAKSARYKAKHTTEGGRPNLVQGRVSDTAREGLTQLLARLGGISLGELLEQLGTDVLQVVAVTEADLTFMGESLPN